MRSKRGISLLLILSLALVFTFSQYQLARGEETIKVGLLEDRTGIFALHGTPKYHATQLAVAEINEKGGILGRKLELLAPDPQSDNRRFQELARRLVLKDKVDVLMGGFASAEREAIRPIVDEYEQLYFYNNQYEGGVADKWTFCTGALPEQQILPAVEYMVKTYGPKMYIVAADYNFGQISAMWTHVAAGIYGAEVVGEEFVPLSVSHFSSTLERIQKAKPDFLVMYITGEPHAEYYPQAHSAGFKYPMASSINMAQGYEHLRFKPPTMTGMHVTINYMEEIPSKENLEFVQRWHKMFPDEPYISQQAQNAYIAVHIYAKAVKLAGTTDQKEVIKALESGITFNAPEGQVFMDPATHHLTHPIRLIRADEKHVIQILDYWPYIEPWWLRSIGVNLVAKPEFKQYLPWEDPRFEKFKK